MPEATIKDIFELGQVKEVMTIVRRMQDLSEFGCNEQAEAVRQHEAEFIRLVELVDSERRLLREKALRLLKTVKKHWSSAEIEEATGYPV